MAIHLTKFLLKGTINLANNLAPLGVLVVGGWFVLEGATTVGVVVAFRQRLRAAGRFPCASWWRIT